MKSIFKWVSELTIKSEKSLVTKVMKEMKISEVNMRPEASAAAGKGFGS